MTDPPLRFVDAAVTQQEVPDEISLTITVSNCRFRCPGCHSPYLQQDIGQPLLASLDALIAPYEDLITCVCLMGEGRNLHEQEIVLLRIRSHAQRTCLYSGSNDSGPFEPLLPHLDYLKLGEYCEAVGGLDSPATNQRFYRIERNGFIDQTRLFQRKKEFH